MKEKLRKSLLPTLFAFVLIAAIVLPANACGRNSSTDQNNPGAPAAPSEAAGVTELGEGDKTFHFEAVKSDTESSKYLIHTGEDTVGAALLALGLIAGDDGSYGLYVKTVDGVTADFDIDGSYWAFYIGGEYASTGVDKTEIKEDETYAFKIEK